MITRRLLSLCLVSLLAGIASCAHRTSPTLTPGHFPADPEGAARRQYEQFLAQLATEPGAVRTRSGLVYRELSPGRGAQPRESDTVTVRYQVKTPDGRIVADSTAHGGSITVALDAVDPCMREAMLLTRAGGVVRFACPLPPPSDVAPGTAPPAPTVLETTLVAIGQRLPPIGH